MRIVDLFCGCGGFALGAREAGLGPQLSIDVDRTLTSSVRLNDPSTRLALADIAGVSGADVEREIGGRVDGVFGGPPCQAFSDIGHRRVDDPRRGLLGHFFRLVSELRPAFFVMENVKGLAYADARPVLDDALDKVAGSYDLLGPMVLDAADFGAATRRPRLFVVGIDPARCGSISERDLDRFRKPHASVRAAIADVASAVPIGSDGDFDLWKIRRPGRTSRYASALRQPEGTFTGHARTAHTPEVIARFAAIPPGGKDVVGRHPRLDWNGLCPTLRAGTGSDRGSFQSVRPIHPEEPRVITVREAARLQGFPDSFRFHPTIWHSFRMIGNSVSPIMARAIFGVLSEALGLARFDEAAE